MREHNQAAHRSTQPGDGELIPGTSDPGRGSQVDEARALLGAAGEHRALLATMMLAGLRVSEACALRWRDVELARGRLRVAEVEDERRCAGRRDLP